jgi:hypothetical protein
MLRSWEVTVHGCSNKHGRVILRHAWLYGCYGVQGNKMRNRRKWRRGAAAVLRCTPLAWL